MFSIIIPVYNKAQYIAGAIECVYAQTFRDWEIIIVDDGSTDDFEAAIAPFADDPRITIFRKQNGGVSTARNKGMELARYPYYCFLDADDEWTKDHLALNYEMIQKEPGAGMYVTGHTSVYDSNKAGKPCPNFAQSGIHRTDNLFEYIENMHGRMNFSTICSCVAAEAVKKSGMFEPGVYIGEDTDFFLRIGLYSDVVMTNQVTAIYHLDRSTAIFQMGRLNYDWVFEHREAGLMADEHISDSTKRYIRCYLGRFRNHKIRHYLMKGQRKEARAELKKICNDPRIKKTTLITRCMMLFPASVLRYIYKMKKESDLL